MQLFVTCIQFELFSTKWLVVCILVLYLYFFKFTICFGYLDKVYFRPACLSAFEILFNCVCQVTFIQGNYSEVHICQFRGNYYNCVVCGLFQFPLRFDRLDTVLIVLIKLIFDFLLKRTSHQLQRDFWGVATRSDFSMKSPKTHTMKISKKKTWQMNRLVIL